MQPFVREAAPTGLAGYQTDSRLDSPYDSQPDSIAQTGLSPVTLPAQQIDAVHAQTLSSGRTNLDAPAAEGCSASSSSSNSSESSSSGFESEADGDSMLDKAVELPAMVAEAHLSEEERQFLGLSSTPTEFI